MNVVIFLCLLFLGYEMYQEFHPSKTSLRGTSVVLPDIPNISAEKFTKIQRLILIPGGGGGSKESANPGYPEWTKRRIVDANTFYAGLSLAEQEKTLFVLLSAGSFNSPNSLQMDKRVIFECQHMIDHLKELGIPKEKIFGDIFSWDTVTNGLSLRLLLDGLAVYQSIDTSIQIEVFISDFHFQRMEAVLTWILGLEPSLLSAKKVHLNMHSVHSNGIPELTPETLQERAKHEAKGAEIILANSKKVRTVQEFYAFIMLGGHLGIRNYLLNDYVKSKGGGW